MAIDVRSIAPDELSAWSLAVDRGFLARTGADGEPRAGLLRNYVDYDRAQAAFDSEAGPLGANPVATFLSFATELTVPGGGQLAADAISGVTTAGSHRRRGLLRRMMTRDLSGAVQRGEALAILIAAEWPIYGRFGFAPATDHASYRITTAAADFTSAPTGRCDFASAPDLRDAAAELHERVRRTQPGAIARKPHQHDVRYERTIVPGTDLSKQLCIAHRDDGGTVDGIVRFTFEGDFANRVSASKVKVSELVAATPAAYLALWRCLCELDWVAFVDADDRPADEPLQWLLTDGRAIRQTARADFLWLRLLDVPAALSARRYAAAGRAVVEVLDPLGHAAGCYLLDGGPEGATCRPSSESPDVTLTVQALSAAYLGGTALAPLARHTDHVAGHTAGAVDRLDAMLRTATLPFCDTWF